ncbi:BNR repeat protein, partial [Kutzneria sp. 744]
MVHTRRFLAFTAVVAAGVAATVIPASATGARPNIVPSAAGAAFTPMSPTRVLDTRDGTGTGGAAAPVGANGTVKLDLSAAIPAGATAVVFNLTAADVTASTSITAWPDGEAQPVSSNLNLVAGDVRPNLVTVAVGANRTVDLFNHFGSVDLIADLAGYYATGNGSRFTSMSPTRVLDTRDGTGTGGAKNPVGPNGVVSLDLSAVLPSTATAAVFNLTGTDTTASTVVIAYPDGTNRPSASNLNLVAGQTAPNLVTVAVGASRKVDLFNLSGSVNLIADLAGYYATDRGNPFHSLTPVRALDSRDANGNSVNPYGPNTARPLDLTQWLPPTAAAAVFNLTGTNTSASTVVTAYPDGTARPGASNLNLVAGQTAPNLSIVALGSDGAIQLFNLSGTVDLILDVAGYFGPAPQACDTGCVFGAGDNTHAQLANGSIGGSTTAMTPIAGLNHVSAVTGGQFNGYALRTDGTVWGWGDNTVRQLGNGKSTGYSTVPYPVSALDGGVQAIAGNGFTTYALRNGSVWVWGDNTYGQLGNGTTNPTTVPRRITTLTGITQIAAGQASAYALRNDGTVWAWGRDANGELGDSGTTNQSAPVRVGTLTGVVSIAAIWTGGFAVTSDGKAWAWGSNVFGGLNNTTTTGNATAPVQMDLTGVKSVASGAGFTGYAVKNDGSVWAWGDNTDGQFG